MNNELKHFGVPGMKWGVRKDRLNDKAYSRKKKKALKLQRKINKVSQIYGHIDKVYETRKYDSDKYRRDSKKYKPRNAYYKIMRKYTQAYLDQGVKEYKVLSEIGKYKTNRLLKKVGKDPYLHAKVYLKDIWGLNNDYYEINASNEPRINKKDK